MNQHKDNRKAIILILIGMTVFALQDTFIKLLSQDTNIYLIYFCRCIIGLFVTFAYLKINNIPIVIKTHYPLLTSLRSIAFFFGFSLYYYSLTKLSLAIAVTLFFVSPFFISILSMLIIKEKIGLRRWMAILVGFIGVYLVMNPKFDDFNIYSLFPVICAMCYAFTVIIQKKTSDKDSLFSQVIHIYISAIIFSVIINLSLTSYDFQPETIERYKFLLTEWRISNYINLLMLLGIGLTGVTGFFCLFGAYNIGSPATIAPFEYIIIFWAILISWFLWGETLSFKAYIGLILIISAGFYTFLREINLNKRISIDKPLR
jgi:drug/metabolite transporter (DMT)-like permease